MALTHAQDFALDLIWFLDDGKSFAPLDIGEGGELDAARSKRSLVLKYVLDPKNAKRLPALRKRLKAAMKKMGFGKSPNIRKDAFFLKELKSRTYELKAPRGRAIRLYVYTDPSRRLGVAGVTRAIARCRGARKGVCDGSTAVTCGYANYARILARKTGGVAIGIDDRHRDGLALLWSRIRRHARNRRIVQLSFLDHGAASMQQVGSSQLKASTPIPRDIANYFAANAEIRLYGCNTFSRAQFRSNPLATRLAGGLLPRGGKVTGATSTIGVDTTLMTIKAKELRKLISIPFSPWSGLAELLSVLALAESFAAVGKKIGMAAPREAARTAIAAAPDMRAYPKRHPGGYPDEYPDLAYYS